MAYALGVIVGLAVGLGIVVLLFRKKVMDKTFDERQALARGKAYCYGFFTLMGCVVAYGLSEELLGAWCDTLTGCVLCIGISLTVFAVVCIRNDAYLSLKEEPRKVMTAFAVIAVLNLGMGIASLANGRAAGEPISGAVNLITGTATLVIMIVYFADRRLREREETE